MRPEVCIICNDPHRFNVALHDAERITQQLKQMLTKEEYEKKDMQLWQNLTMDRQHVHFMCGTCIKVDTGRLHRAEEKLAQTVYNICVDIRNGKEYPIHNILRLLQGYYPLMYRCVEREYRKKKMEGDKA